MVVIVVCMLLRGGGIIGGQAGNFDFAISFFHYPTPPNPVLQPAARLKVLRIDQKIKVSRTDENCLAGLGQFATLLFFDQFAALDGKTSVAN